MENKTGELLGTSLSHLEWLVVQILPLAETAKHLIHFDSVSAIQLFRNSTIRLFDYSTVRLFDCSTIRLFDYSTIELSRSKFWPRLARLSLGFSRLSFSRNGSCRR